MDKKQIIQALTEAKKISKKRNFNQSIDLIITIKDLDLKKVENQVETFTQLHYSKGKKIKVCGLVGGELLEQSKEFFDNTISAEEFEKYQKNPKSAKKLAKEYDYFVAQATIMPKIAQIFGKAFGPRGKMPNPKAGCVVPPNANLEQLGIRLHHLVRISIKSVPMIQLMVGKEESKEEEIIDNIMSIYNHLVHSLPKEESNIKNVFIKTTMGKPVLVGKKEKAEDEKK
ncbi:MAG: 50S ribosomal protein L1 [Candidatus Woesearchaeota archaeon]